ncbi:hypothetical protein [Chryseobacterium lathyri]|uniref:hypothetical protein n=1 Tax=Chryseobacterium lathyri TaxID=395933 RepID=UPI00277EC62D|nr:hypothetical protein [Chryseobacterium lathyri]MDQ0068064.1 hypothetical protein [Chryseobacterium lathyri]
MKILCAMTLGGKLKKARINSSFIYQNQLPEKLIEQYEQRLKDKETEIAYLRKLIDKN